MTSPQSWSEHPTTQKSVARSPVTIWAPHAYNTQTATKAPTAPTTTLAAWPMDPCTTTVHGLHCIPSVTLTLPDKDTAVLHLPCAGLSHNQQGRSSGSVEASSDGMKAKPFLSPPCPYRTPTSSLGSLFSRTGSLLSRILLPFVPPTHQSHHTVSFSSPVSIWLALWPPQSPPCTLCPTCSLNTQLLSSYQSWAFNNSHSHSSGGWRARIEGPAGLVSNKGHVQTCRCPLAVSSEGRALVSSSNKGTNPLTALAKPKPLAPNTITWGVRAANMNLGEMILLFTASIIKA